MTHVPVVLCTLFFRKKMDRFVILQLRLNSKQAPQSHHTLEAIYMFFAQTQKGTLSEIMSYIRKFYKLPVDFSLSMSLLREYLRNIPFLYSRSYVSSSGKRLDVFFYRQLRNFQYFQ